ncbi:unnamed protein product, partial [Heterotrigona itama]
QTSNNVTAVRRIRIVARSSRARDRDPRPTERSKEHKNGSFSTANQHHQSPTRCCSSFAVRREQSNEREELDVLKSSSHRRYTRHHNLQGRPRFDACSLYFLSPHSSFPQTRGPNSK